MPIVGTGIALRAAPEDVPCFHAGHARELEKESIMTSRTVGTAIVLGTLLAAGCNSATKADKEAREAQQKADDEAARARSEAEQTAAKAQANANEQAREADRTLLQQKSDFRLSKQKELDDLNRRIDDVRAKSTTAKNDVKTSVDAALAEAMQRRATVESELRALDTAAAAELDQVKDRINQQLALFKKSVSEAEKRI
jgi:hypothetical protein